MNCLSEFKSCIKIWMSNWIFCLIFHNGMFIQSLLSVLISGGFVWIFNLYRFHHGYEFKSCPFKVLLSFVNLLSHISQWKFHSKLLVSMDFWWICKDLWSVSISSLVLLKFFCLLWIFCHVSHNGILFAVSFKATCHSRLVLSNPDVKLKWLMY